MLVSETELRGKFLELVNLSTFSLCAQRNISARIPNQFK
jgi:hypothetical protein